MFGQTPNIAKVQAKLYLQLTGTDLKADLEASKRGSALREACEGKTVLLVLDDVWEVDHFQFLNVIDPNTESKVCLCTH